MITSAVLRACMRLVRQASKRAREEERLAEVDDVALCTGDYLRVGGAHALHEDGSSAVRVCEEREAGDSVRLWPGAASAKRSTR